MKKEFNGASLGGHLGAYKKDIERYCKCYNIDIQSFCVKPQAYFAFYQEMYEEDSLSFFSGHKSRIEEFNKEFWKQKSAKQVCDAMNITLEQFKEWYLLNYLEIEALDNGNPATMFQSADEITNETILKRVSTQYLIHLYHGFPKKISRDHVSIEIERIGFGGIAGYEDLKEIIAEQLIPIIDNKALNLWKIRKPGGIILFGPPGCGKTFWASQIAQYLGFKFEEIPRSAFASIYVDGAIQNLKPMLDKIEPKTVVFFDEFDSVASSRSASNSSSAESSKVVNTLLQEIPKLIEREILIIAATNYLSRIDAAVIRPGRFDLKIPIFPPNPKERAQLIYQKISAALPIDSPLKEILKQNKIVNSSYFENVSRKMGLYSASLIEDFVDTIKRKLKSDYESGIPTEKLIIDERLLDQAITSTNAKITNQDFEFLANFYLEVDSFTDPQIYSSRLKILKEELGIIYRDQEDPPKPIGYRSPKID